MYLDLCSDNWTLEGYLPMCHRFNLESGVDFRVGPIIPKRRASVPGSVHDEMEKAGLIGPVYYETNHLQAEWIENKCWAYEREVELDEQSLNRKILLVCEGLNFEARVYWNGHLLGVHRNVHTPARFDLTGKAGRHNTLTILLENIPREDGQMGRSSQNRDQCERFAYGWDFCTALIGVGIWKKVGLYVYDSCLLEDVSLLTDYDGQTGHIRLEGSGYPQDTPLTLRMRLHDGDALLAEEAIPFTGSFFRELTIADPKLWYPNGYGEQPLYTVSLELWDGDNLQDARQLRAGIRRLEYRQNEGSPEQALPYTVLINGKKIWLKAAVLLPLDQRLGHIRPQDYVRYVQMLKNANITMIRLWGGGVNENDILFDLCDENGILVWQDFTQSNAGLDGVPSVRPEFLEELRRSSIQILKRNRNHTCQTVYIGGNELRRAEGLPRRPVQADNPNIRMLEELVRQYDGSRLFHTSSPSGPNFDLQFDEETCRKQNNHNVHSVWAYLGKTEHYAYYNKADYLYLGEFGTNGAPDESTLRRIFSEQTLARFADPSVNWYLRNISWWNSWPRDRDLFGAENLRTPEAYTAASQMIQAEGIRYTVERSRARAFHTSGCCIWQFNEPFPNPNCTNLVDFFGLPKMAYSWVQKAYAQTTPLLRYDRIFYLPGETAVFELAVSHLGSAEPAEVTATLRSEKAVLAAYRYAVCLQEDCTTMVDELKIPVTEKMGDLFFLEVTVRTESGYTQKNLYSFGTRETTPYAAFFRGGRSAEITCEYRDGEKYIRVKNTGDAPCYFVGALPQTEDRPVLTANNYVTVFPGETECIRVQCGPDDEVLVKDFTRGLCQTV